MEVAYIKVCITIQDIREKGKHYFVLLHCEFCIMSMNHVYSTAKKIPYTAAKMLKKVSTLGKELWSHCGLDLLLSQKQGRNWKNYTSK